MRAYNLKINKIIDFIIAAKLDPNRASRKFTQPKPLEDPNIELKEKQAARLDRLNALGDDDEIALEKKKAQRLEAAKQLEQKYKRNIKNLL